MGLARGLRDLSGGGKTASSMAPVESRWHFAGQLVLIRTDLYPSLIGKDQGRNKGARRGFCSPFVLAVETEAR